MSDKLNVDRTLNHIRLTALLQLSDRKVNGIEWFVAHYRGETFSSIAKRYGTNKQAVSGCARWYGRQALIKAHSIKSLD